MTNPEPAWRSYANLPSHDGNGWSILKRKAVHRMSIDDIRSALRRWVPQDTLLVGAPGATKFLPPICVPQLRDIMLSAVERNTKLIAAFFVACGVLMLLGSVVGEVTASFLLLPATFIFAGMLFYVDLKIGLRTNRDICDRSMFFRWLKVSKAGQAASITCLSFVLAIGLLQLYLQFELGGIKNVFDTFGAMYPAIRNGETWRLISGPYLHYSITHYVVNSALLLFIGTVTLATNWRSGVIVFFVGNSIGAWMQMSFGGQVFDSYGGISPGIYALFGLFVTSAVLGAIRVPKGMPFLCGGLAILGIASSSLISANAATVAHVYGLLVGVLAALLLACFGNQSRAEAIR